MIFPDFGVHNCWARNTEVGYAYDWKMFIGWCEQNALNSLPAQTQTVATYLAAILKAGRKVTTARRRCCAIAHYHRQAGLPNPITRDVKESLAQVQRARRERPRQMRPLGVEDLRRISQRLAALGTPTAMRDRAILVVGFASALRRSSIAELMLEDIEFTKEGFIISVRAEKQDQKGRGRLIGIPRGAHLATCPVLCLGGWLQLRGTQAGPLFPRLDRKHELLPMDGECVYRVVKKCVALIGIDPDDHIGGHSLRAGFVTAAGEAGATDLLIAAQTGHRTLAMVRRYFRQTSLFKGNACGLLGL